MIVQPLFFIFFTVFIIYSYVSILKEYNLEDQDPLNKKIIELEVCGWNLLHVFVYFMLCLILNVRTIFGYMGVFLTGIVWYFLERMLFMKYSKNHTNNGSEDTVYDSISDPRPDDLVYNFIGIMIRMYRYSNFGR